MSKSNASRVDVYARVTETIIVSLEQVRRPWHQPCTDSASTGGAPEINYPLRRSRRNLPDASMSSACSRCSFSQRTLVWS